MSTRNIYCIDTSSIIEAWTRAYPRDHFPSVWERIERLIVDGRLRAPREVLDELERQEDGAHQWAKAQSGLVVPLNPEHAAEVQRIQEDFPYYNTEVGFSAGDPWVIALAKLYKYIVVTEETSAPRKRKAKIPDVCDRYGIEHITVLELIRRENWTF